MGTNIIRFGSGFLHKCIPSKNKHPPWNMSPNMTPNKNGNVKHVIIPGLNS